MRDLIASEKPENEGSESILRGAPRQPRSLGPVAQANFAVQAPDCGEITHNPLGSFRNPFPEAFLKNARRFEVSRVRGHMEVRSVRRRRLIHLFFWVLSLLRVSSAVTKTLGETVGKTAFSLITVD